MSAYANSDELDMAGKVDRKVIDLRTGENFDPEYIKIVSTPYTLAYSAPSIAPIFHSLHPRSTGPLRQKADISALPMVVLMARYGKGSQCNDPCPRRRW